MRQVHGYSRVARVDLRPSQSARLRIERRGGEPLFDFRVTTGSDAFRIVEGAAEDAPRGARYVHAIGDSYTMGWGVDAALSYPAQLARRLGPGLAVLNLGVDGFGAIGATAKSRALADRYPPAAAVYLFCPNDLDDDVQAAAVERREKRRTRRTRLSMASGGRAIWPGCRSRCATGCSSGRGLPRRERAR